MHLEIACDESARAAIWSAVDIARSLPMPASVSTQTQRAN
jgi:hypothetical protein